MWIYRSLKGANGKYANGSRYDIILELLLRGRHVRNSAETTYASLIHPCGHLNLKM